MIERLAKEVNVLFIAKVDVLSTIVASPFTEGVGTNTESRLKARWNCFVDFIVRVLVAAMRLEKL